MSIFDNNEFYPTPKNLLEKMQFKSDVIPLSEFVKDIKDENILKKAADMALLQPEQAGIGRVLTKQQAYDVLKEGSVTSPEFMQKIFKERFGADLTNPYKYISMKKITKFRESIDKYIKAAIESADKFNGGKVDIDFLNKVNKKSFALSAGFRISAMGVSAFALGFAIPKLQYWMTERRTGLKTAPGFRKYKEND